MLGVHGDVVHVLNYAIEHTPIDFTIVEGLRTFDRQKELYAAGGTKTYKSRHLTGHAVDIAPWVGGEVRWDWPLFFRLAEVLADASRQTGIPLVWGGAWVRLDEVRHDVLPEDLVSRYVERKRRADERPLCDGPHYHLPREEYPGEYSVGMEKSEMFI